MWVDVYREACGGKIFQCEKAEAPREDGTPGWVRWSVQPWFDPDGNIGGLIHFSEDITARIRTEENIRRLDAQLLQSQKLESLGVLAGGIAHDFNNLLMAIMGNIDLGRAKLATFSPAQENFEAAEKSCLRAADLCSQMLAYSGRGKFVVESINLSKVVSDMLHMLQVSISKKAQLQIDLDEKVPLIKCDVTQIRQVIMNLVINASDAIGSNGGNIRVTTGSKICSLEDFKDLPFTDGLEPGPYVLLEVADSGCGMDKDVLNRIFEPFFSTKFTGRGLGLAAVQGIVKGHNGAIRVLSSPEQGSSFQLLFPAEVEHQEDAVTKVEADASMWKGSGTILLVDDELCIRSLGRQMLEFLGFTVLTAEDGFDAIETFQKHSSSIRCVLLDLTMPRMDGDETFKALRNLSQDLPVIMTSGYSEQEITARFADRGLTDFIQKPYKLNMLKEKLQKVVVDQSFAR